MAQLYKCTGCKVDKSYTKEEQGKKFTLEEMGTIKENKYCFHHLELEMEKRVKCTNCTKTVKRKNGVYVSINTKFSESGQDEEAKKSEKLFCSDSCGAKYQENLLYKDKFFRKYVKFHNLEGFNEIQKVIFVQLEGYRTKREMSYIGMCYTLDYISIKKLTMPKNSVWMILQEYDNARDYFTQINIQNRIMEEMKEVKVVTRYFKLPEKSKREDRVKNLLYLPED